MGTGVMLSGASERVLGCDRGGCGQVRRGRHGRFCSDACRAADWKARHGGAQRLIDFRSAAEPVPVPRPASTELAWLTPNQDFVGHSTEPPQWIAGSPARRHGQGSTRVTPAPATGEPYESARVWLLGRLQVSPVSTLELRCPPWRASQNPAQRVLELRNRQHDIRTVRLGRRTWYWLHIDGMPVGVVPEGE